LNNRGVTQVWGKKPETLVTSNKPNNDMNVHVLTPSSLTLPSAISVSFLTPMIIIIKKFVYIIYPYIYYVYVRAYEHVHVYVCSRISMHVCTHYLWYPCNTYHVICAIFSYKKLIQAKYSIVYNMNVRIYICIEYRFCDTLSL
jgi:hypothetical protein